MKPTIISLLFIALLTGNSFADAATHVLTLRAFNFEDTDCGSDGCVPTCQVNGTMALSGVQKRSVPLEVWLRYRTDSTDAGFSTVSLAFQMAGFAGREATGWVPGRFCENVIIDEVEIVCPEEARQRCPGFYNVQIPKVSRMQLLNQKIIAK